MNCPLRHFSFAIVLAAVCVAPIVRADDRPEVKWEYRIASKDQLLDLGNKNLASGLNELGREGWELVVVEGSYVFKRPHLPHDREIADIKFALTLLLREREQHVERLAWSEQMFKKGFISESQVASDRDNLEKYNLAVERKRKELDSLTPLPSGPRPHAPAPREGKPGT